MQIGYWFDGEGQYKVATRIVTKEEANKPYRFDKGVWTAIEEAEK